MSLRHSLAPLCILASLALSACSAATPELTAPGSYGAPVDASVPDAAVDVADAGPPPSAVVLAPSSPAEVCSWGTDSWGCSLSTPAGTSFRRAENPAAAFDVASAELVRLWVQSGGPSNLGWPLGVSTGAEDGPEAGTVFLHLRNRLDGKELDLGYRPGSGECVWVFSTTERVLPPGAQACD